MEPNAFIGKTAAPTVTELAAALGLAKETWDKLLAELNQELGVDASEWNSYSPKAGWSLRVKRGARTIVWLGPRKDAFLASFVLGAKAMQAARVAKLPQKIVKLMDAAPKYPEGFGVRITAKSARDLPAIKHLAAVKIAN